ncbi:hypothetical protein [Nitrosomonas sp.]|uniref:hypothetical protein n=1 Tax=Nitrosomonas sp. TaxID=42353 RepID=UPI0025D0253A|nr:hypothetical protein [Nitrosomonas sp.]
MDNFICYVQEYHEFFDILIKLLVFLVATGSALFALWSYNITVRKTKYEFFRDLNKDFLDDEFIAKRIEVASFWRKRFLKTQDNTKLRKVGRIANLDDEKIKDYLSMYLGITFIDTTEEFLKINECKIRKTEEILNKYEHLAKLVEIRVIHKKEIEKFFYTMFADTFVVCLPFILYRRKSKPTYARKMQNLLKTLPALSHLPIHA